MVGVALHMPDPACMHAQPLAAVESHTATFEVVAAYEPGHGALGCFILVVDWVRFLSAVCYCYGQ